MELHNIFNATVTVAWAVFFVPYAIEEEKFRLLGLVSAPMLITQITISMNVAPWEFPFNFLVGVSNFCFGLLVGYCMYLYESRKQKDES